MTNKLFFQIASILTIFACFISCRKAETNVLSEMDNLVIDYKLNRLDKNNLPKGIVIQKFNSISEARIYLQKISTELSKTKRKKGKITTIIPSGSLYNSTQLNGSNYTFSSPNMSYCSPCSGGFVNATTDFTLASTMHLAFNYSSKSGGGYDISNLSTYTTGVTLLSWNQTGFSNYSSSSYISFCVQGTVTVGIQIENITLGYTTEHYYYISHNPCGGGYDITDGSGGC